jgi:hypothetical protein
MKNITSKDLPEHEISLLKRVIEQADKMPQAVARYFARLKLSAEDIDRVNLLSAKAREGSLDDEENEELDSYLRIGAFLSIVQSKARRTLAANERIR